MDILFIIWLFIFAPWTFLIVFAFFKHIHKRYT